MQVECVELVVVSSFMEDSQCQWPHVLQKLFSYILVSLVDATQPKWLHSNEKSKISQPSSSSEALQFNAKWHTYEWNAYLQYAEIIRISICSADAVAFAAAHSTTMDISEDRNNQNQNQNIFVKLILLGSFAPKFHIFFLTVVWLKSHLEKAGYKGECRNVQMMYTFDAWIFCSQFDISVYMHIASLRWGYRLQTDVPVASKHNGLSNDTTTECEKRFLLLVFVFFFNRFFFLSLAFGKV